MTAMTLRPQDYSNPYMRALENPLPELRETFQEELKILLSHCTGKTVLDVGAGSGRPAKDLSPHCKKLICIDNSKKMVKLATENLKGISNTTILEMDGIQTAFKDNTFDVTFATYNLLGSIPEQKELVKEMTRVTKKGGKVIIFYWKNDAPTTEFLKKYYPSIGINIVNITPRQTMTSYGVFERPLVKYVEELMSKNELKNIQTLPSGPVWNVSIGEK